MRARNRSAPPAHHAPPFHDPWTPHDFPDTTTPICRGCSYSPDGTPLEPVPYPCPFVIVTPPPDPPDSGEQPSPLQRLAQAARNRRIALGLSQRQVADRAPAAIRTVLKVENARPGPLRERTAFALERALQWQAGSIYRVLDGGEPVESSRPPVSGTPEVAAVLQANLPAEVEEALVAHLSARRADMEAALEGEARMLIDQVRSVARMVRHAGNTTL